MASRASRSASGSEPSEGGAPIGTPEEVLRAQHPVGQQVEAGLLLNRDELGEVAFDLLVDGLLRGARPIEVARRLNEPL